MGTTNYIISIVKILENPIRLADSSAIKFRVQLPTGKKSRIISLIFWGKLADEVEKYYKANDFIIIEGYLSLHYTEVSKLTVQKLKEFKKLKMIKITVFKVYPFLLNSDREIKNLST